MTEGDVRIAGYRLLERLGEGGMGVVYRAEQLEPVRREVALKLIRVGADSAAVVRRFEAERQALAVMEHPSIARVYDAGATEDGRPYFVMELVRGVPLLEYCDERSLVIRDRIRLFTQVCRAVQHAHQKGVIHRDLKPSNILVTEADGAPLVKVIDFGIARAVDVEGGADATRVTMADEVVGTPVYMSPEQWEGAGDIDTRSDIYSLGVVLYELLSGALPFDAASYRGWAAYAAARHRDTPTPSRRVVTLGEGARESAVRRRSDPIGLARALRGDLDWIVMTAVEQDRERRYETATALALDLERVLADEPVLARPPSTAYRARKFVKRNTAGVAFAGILAMLLVGVAAVQSVQAGRIARARDVADARRSQAEGLIDFMLGDLRAKLEPIGRLDLLDDVGDQAVAYFAALPASEFSDEDLLSRSKALSQIGQVRLNEGKVPEAQDALRESLRLAVALSERAPDDADRLFQLSQSRFWVGYAAWQHGDLASAEDEFRGYLDAAERLVAIDPENLDYRLELGFAHSNLGSVREARGDLAGAAEAFRLTLETKEELVRSDSSRVDWLGELAESHNTLAVVYRKQGRYAAALAEHQRELDLKRQVLVLAPGHAYWRLRLGWAHHFLGRLQLATGDAAGALEHSNAAVAVLDSLVSHDPANATWRRALAAARSQVGLNLAILDRRKESLAALGTSRRLMEDLVRTDTVALDWRPVLGSIHAERARVLLHFGETDSALVAAEGAVSILGGLDTTARPAALRLAAAELVLGQAHLASGRDAGAVLGRALERLEAAKLPGEEGDLGPLLAEAYLLAGRPEEARRELDALRARGYREPFLSGLATRHGHSLGS